MDLAILHRKSFRTLLLPWKPGIEQTALFPALLRQKLRFCFLFSCLWLGWGLKKTKDLCTKHGNVTVMCPGHWAKTQYNMILILCYTAQKNPCGKVRFPYVLVFLNFRACTVLALFQLYSLTVSTIYRLYLLGSYMLYQWYVMYNICYTHGS